MRIINHSRRALIADEARVADTFFGRLRGLLGTKALPPGQGLILRPCDSVHTIGMAYSIDVLYLNQAGRVLKCVASLGPCRFSVCWQASMVVELPAGTISKTGTGEGDRLSFDAE